MALVRFAQGLSRTDLAEMSGVTRQTIRNIEVGRHVPQTHTATAICEALNVKVETLFARVHGKSAA
jgi:DNA-binding XRE family transcriptional regulator